MKTHTLFFAVIAYALITAPAMAMQESGSSGTMGGHDMKSGQQMDQGTHGMQMDHSGMGGNFKYTATEEGIDAEFQVMSLASMNMTSDKGETHHIMVNLKAADGGAPIKNAIGKIKVIGPDKSEQEGTLKNYSGILAANFTFKEPGKYGVICLLKNGDNKAVFKFWYHHMQ
jgi:hypothetical protein